MGNKRWLTVLAALAVPLGVASPAAAADGGSNGSPTPPIVVSPLHRGGSGGVGIVVHSPGHGGSSGVSGSRGHTSQAGSSSGGSGGGAAAGNTHKPSWFEKHCGGSVYQPQVLLDPRCDVYRLSNLCTAVNGAGLSAAQYAQYQKSMGCPAPTGQGPAAGAGPRPPALPSPAVLARRAYRQLNLPRPVMHRSPDENNSDPQFGGQSYTWVNLSTYFWTSPNTWSVRTRTATAGPVSATVTARPTELLIDPGNGAGAVTCGGPGVPWTKADAHSQPPADACAYMYQRVTQGSAPLTATMTIRWRVSWAGTGGAAGTLPVMQTQVASNYLVEQIQTVNTGGR